VVLSAGTTTTEVARALKGRQGLSVITNALNIAQELANEPGLAVTCTGGDVHADYHTLTGPVAERALRAYFFDVAVIGVSGIAREAGLTVTSQLNAMTMEIMVDHAMQLIVVADQQKWGQVSRAYLAPLHAIDILVTDAEPPEEVREALAAAHVEVLVAVP
jgi:DeoR family transcriptional regulator of aga operon